MLLKISKGIRSSKLSTFFILSVIVAMVFYFHVRFALMTAVLLSPWFMEWTITSWIFFFHLRKWGNPRGRRISAREWVCKGLWARNILAKRVCARLGLCRIMCLGLICAPMHASSPGCSTECGHHSPLFKTVFKRCSKKSESFGFSFLSFISLA